MIKKSILLKDNIEVDSNVDDYVKSIVKPIFETELAKETSKNRMSVGLARFGDSVFCLYQPHNYRLYFDFQKLGYRPPKTNPKRSVVVTDEYKFKVKNGSEHFFKGFMGCSVTVKRQSIEIINQIEHKRWFRIELKDDLSFEDQIKAIVIKKDDECRKVLKEFIVRFGGCSGFSLLNRRSEDKVSLEDSVDKLPLKMAFHGSLVKKVYNESNVEFKDPAFVVNYLENRAFEKIAPDVANELVSIRSELDLIKSERVEFSKCLALYTEQINLHLEVERRQLVVQDDTLQTLKDIRDSLKLSRQERASKLLKEWGW